MCDEFYVKTRSDDVAGPFTAAKLKHLAKTKKIGSKSLIRVGADGEWLRAKSVFENLKKSVPEEEAEEIEADANVDMATLTNQRSIIDPDWTLDLPPKDLLVKIGASLRLSSAVMFVPIFIVFVVGACTWSIDPEGQSNAMYLIRWLTGVLCLTVYVGLSVYLVGKPKPKGGA